MGRKLRIGVAAMVMCASVTGVWAQSSSSSPFSGFSGLFGGRNRQAEQQGPKVDLQFAIINGDEKLVKPIKNASVIAGALAENRSTGQDVLAAARADYARILGVMYDEGYFSSIITITLDGVEAAEIAPLDAPERVYRVVVAIDPGRQFHFARADIGPLAPGTRPIKEYAVGEVAQTGVIKRATSSAITEWRDYGSAKAKVADDEIIADHETAMLESRIALNPGPVVTFGQLHITGQERMNLRRLRKIAGFPTGERFSPEKLDDVRKRLRRAGVFSAITLVEAESLNPDNSLDVGLTVVEQKLRRIGFGFEVSNQDGAMLSAYWLHRNLFGGAERLRIDGKVSDINADSDALDYSFGVRIDRPATLTPDTTAYVDVGIKADREPDVDEDSAWTTLGFNHIASDRLSFDTAIQYLWSRIDYGLGPDEFRVIALPSSITLDMRDDDTNAKRGYWLYGGLTPFIGLGDTGTGAQAIAEGRIYRSFGKDDRLTFAGRSRLATVVGSELDNTPRDYLFYSGGGGSVRGQPFESLGVVRKAGTDDEFVMGGMSLATVSAEIRYMVREKIGLVAFADAGRIWDEGAWTGNSDWHAGAGVGVRYTTPIGPIRLDVAAPVEGDTGSGVQLYLGLGQAF